jgi:phage gp29-like protein
VPKRPPTRIVIAQPVAPSITKWTFSRINRALDEHELGQFAASADLADAFGRDDRIRGCLATRVHALLGRNGAEFSFQPSDRGSNKASAKKLAREMHSQWWRLAPEKTLARILRDLLLLGVVIARREWTVIDGEWIPTLRPWPMQHAWWDETSGRYQVHTATGIETIDPEDPGWFVLEADVERSWLSGAVRALGLPFLLRTFDLRDWSRFCERHGLPIIAIKEPPSSTEEQKATFFESMRKLGREGVLRLPQIDEDEGWEVEFIEPKDRGWETFKGFKHELDTGIAIALLGQNLTTEVSGGGSYAAMRGHGRVLQVFLDSDAECLSTGLREGLVKWWVRFNRTDELELAPWPFWDTKLPEDLGARATTIVNASTALATLLERGVRVDVNAYAERFGIPLLEGEPIDEPAEPEPEPIPNEDL